MDTVPVKLNVHNLFEKAKADPSVVTVEGTVDTGFEFLALDECKEIFEPTDYCIDRGRVFINISLDSLLQLKQLRSIDNLFLVVGTVTQFEFNHQSKDDDINELKKLAEELDLNYSLDVWKTFVAYLGITSPTLEQYLEAEQLRKERKAAEAMKKMTLDETNECKESGEGDENREQNNVNNETGKSVEDSETIAKSDDNKKLETAVVVENEEDSLIKVLKFRATCNRVGKHEFTSMEAACDFGGKLQDKHHWLVDLSNYDLDVVLNIRQNEGWICFALTKESLHRRNISHFGPTTLRATLCYNMLRLAQLKTGDIVVDPLCGGGSIPIEGALAFTDTFHIGGDIHEKAVNRTHMNCTHICSVKGCPLPLDIFRWDIGRLPLRTSSVDVFATDLPFGKRSGRKVDNRPLYTKALNEMARVVRPKTGKAVLLTHDRKTLIQVLSRVTMYWGHGWRPFNINLGGLDGGVFMLKRSDRSYMS